MKTILNHAKTFHLMYQMAQRLHSNRNSAGPWRAYPIPRGGVPVAYGLKSILDGWAGETGLSIVDDPAKADVFIDDIIDSGATKARYNDLYPNVLFMALLDKQLRPEDRDLGWVVFPWEGDTEGSAEDITIRLLQYIGEDPNREGLRDTPKRVAKAWADWTSGYGKDVGALLTSFEDGGERYDEMILVKDIPFYTHCEHHLAPFFGTASIAYIPNGKIVGLSKLSRVLDVFAKRLQVQERLTAQVADALMEHLHAKGAAVSIRARHLCMESRGIQKQGHETVTNVLRGVFKNAAVRAEFLASIQ